MPSNRKRRIRQLMAESSMSYQAVLNSLENRGGQENPVPWLIEKTAIALGEAARLVGPCKRARHQFLVPRSVEDRCTTNDRAPRTGCRSLVRSP